MARVSKKHKCYRSKRRIIGDVTTVLNADLHWGTKRAVLKNAIWTWTCFEGKLNCEWWTPEAKKAYDSGDKRVLRHEHVVPLKVLYGLFKSLEAPSRKQVRKIFKQLVIGVVMTNAEHNELNRLFRDTMPQELDATSDWSEDVIWARYDGRIVLERGPDLSVCKDDLSPEDDD